MINKNIDPATKSTSLTLGSGSNANQIAVATILKAYYLWTLTDRWGDIPYTDALQGAGNLSPAFDKQEDIYTHLLEDLKAGVAGFDNGLAVQGDILYGGDQTKWKKLANSLRMLISLRMSKIYPAPGDYAATEFALAYNDIANGYIASNADNLTLKYPGASYKNPYYVIYDGRTDYAFSKTIGDIMSNMNDGRKTAFKASGSDFPYGLERADAINFGAYAQFLEPSFRTESSGVVIVSAAASLLAVAEGIERGWVTTGSAAAAYNQAIAESFAQWGVSGAAAYASGPAANYATGIGGGTDIGANAYGSIVRSKAVTATPIERIFLQRYLALYPDGVQAWSEWRRSCPVGKDTLGMPDLRPTTYATNADAGKLIPKRYVYATAEYS